MAVKVLMALVPEFCSRIGSRFREINFRFGEGKIVQKILPTQFSVENSIPECPENLELELEGYFKNRPNPDSFPFIFGLFEPTLRSPIFIIICSIQIYVWEYFDICLQINSKLSRFLFSFGFSMNLMFTSKFTLSYHVFDLIRMVYVLEWFNAYLMANPH